MVKKLTASRKAMIIVAVMIGLVLGTMGVGQVIASNMNNQDMKAAPVFPTNENGQTYGSSAKCNSIETEPDLIQAIGIDGMEGYVLAKDLNGEMPKTPEEAIAMQKEFPADGILIPLYAVDGKTVIGEFRIKNGETKTKTAKDKN